LTKFSSPPLVKYTGIHFLASHFLPALGGHGRKIHATKLLYRQSPVEVRVFLVNEKITWLVLVKILKDVPLPILNSIDLINDWAWNVNTNNIKSK
jgi:hypothetical protein